MRAKALLLVGLLACGSPTVAIRPAPTASPSTDTPPPSAPPQVGTASEARLRASWRPGCPVAISDLRLLTIDHWGFDGRMHQGELVVHRDVASRVVAVFAELLAARFPIEGMRLVDDFGADDNRSMAANNTSGFNCRRSTGSPGEWSTHSYGTAIDINPVQNPYVSASGEVLPPAGKAFTDRSKRAPGMILAGDVVVTAFAEIGWTWGGSYQRSKDYQHFSASGR